MACVMDKPAYILIRFPTAVHQAAKNDFAVRKSVTENYGGRVLGVCKAEDMCHCDGDFPRDKSFAIFYFRKWEDAKRWEHSVPEIRQSDWLGGADMLLVEAEEGGFDPRLPCLSLLSYDVDSQMKDQMFETFKSIGCEVMKTMSEMKIKPIIANKRVERLRGSWNTFMFYVNQAACMGTYKEFDAKESVCKARNARNSFGTSTIVRIPLCPLK